MIDQPEFKTREEEIEWVLQNKELIITQKKNTFKTGDPFVMQKQAESREFASKEIAPEAGTGNLKADLVINTTNIIDSHMDCHIPGIWKKTVNENPNIFLLQEHKMLFDHVIADAQNDGLKALTKSVSWKELGYKYPGKTEALIFNTSITAKRNPFMYEQYKNGYVLNHSVGMRYVKIFLCVDSNEPHYTAEKEAWDKYYPAVVNKDVADSKGYFWAVTEAKVIEGSAVVMGSNQATPVLNMEEKEIEAGDTTSNKQIEPPFGTQGKQFLANLI